MKLSLRLLATLVTALALLPSTGLASWYVKSVEEVGKLVEDENYSYQVPTGTGQSAPASGRVLRVRCAWGASTLKNDPECQGELYAPASYSVLFADGIGVENGTPSQHFALYGTMPVIAFSSGGPLEFVVLVPIPAIGQPRVFKTVTVSQRYRREGTQCVLEVGNNQRLLNVAAYPVSGASIDTRRSYGNPNAAGSVVPDANWTLQSLNFSTWTFNGGLFVGNMPYTSPGDGRSPDRSGTARMQFYVSGVAPPNDDTLFAALRVLDLGAKPYALNGEEPVMPGSPVLGSYVAGESTQNLSVPMNTFTWATRWGIDPSSTMVDPENYLNWHPNQATSSTTLTAVTASQSAFGELRTLPLTRTTTPEGFMRRFTPSYTRGILVAIFGEADAIGLRYNDAATGENQNPGGTTTGLSWRYFASERYTNPQGFPFPHTDAAPRLYVLSFGGPWQ